MNVLISGGTGFIGSKLIAQFIRNDHTIFVLTRHPDKYQNTDQMTFVDYSISGHELPPIDQVINLAGESLYGYWSEQKKKAMIESRLTVTRNIVRIIGEMNQKPTVFLSASAVGYYGTSNEKIFTEKSLTANDDFLSNVTYRWEELAKEVENKNIRTVYARFGVVLDQRDGAFPLMTLPFRLGVGGKIGNGEQWISWIHIEDCIRLLLFALNNDSLNGPLNLTAPHPIRNLEFTKIVSNKLKRPAFLPAPSRLLHAVIGEMSQLITEGQYVLPIKALDNNFTFYYRYFDDAANDLLS